MISLVGINGSEFDSPGHYNDHSWGVMHSFMLGHSAMGSEYTGAFYYNDTSADYGWTRNLSDLVTAGVKVYIDSTAESYELHYGSIAHNIVPALTVYPQMTIFAPSNGLITGESLSCLVLTSLNNGAGHSTGFPASIEGFSTDARPDEWGHAISFSNGYMAGLLVYMANTLGVDIWTCRYLMRSGKTWSVDDGYGEWTPDSISAAMALYNSETIYDFLDPYDPRIGGPAEIMGIRKAQSVALSLRSIRNATGYEIRKNGILLTTQPGLTYTDTINSTARYDYRGKLDHGGGQIEYSDYSNILQIKLVHFKRIRIAV